MDKLENLSDDSLMYAGIRAALEAGSVIMDVYRDQQDPEISYKSDLSPLTIADKAAHEEIIRHLKGSAEYPVLSEEGSIIPYEERSVWDKFWLVDPLDGTKEFISNNGEFTVNIALVQHGVPVLGVVYAPVIKKLYVGSSGTGSFCVENIDIRTIDMHASHPGKRKTLPIFEQRENYTVIASRSHMNNTTEEFIAQCEKYHSTVDLISAGSSLKLCLIAEGKADIYPRLGPTMEWDTAAAQAVVVYAGGIVVGFEDGRPLTYNKQDLHNPHFIVQLQ